MLIWNRHANYILEETYICPRLEGVGGNVDLAGNPGLAAVAGGEVAGDTGALAEGADVVGVGLVEDDLGVDPL